MNHFPSSRCLEIEYIDLEIGDEDGDVSLRNASYSQKKEVVVPYDDLMVLSGNEKKHHIRFWAENSVILGGWRDMDGGEGGGWGGGEGEI